jgi:hypothetical protein
MTARARAPEGRPSPRAPPRGDRARLRRLRRARRAVVPPLRKARPEGPVTLLEVLLCAFVATALSFALGASLGSLLFTNDRRSLP